MFEVRLEVATHVHTVRNVLEPQFLLTDILPELYELLEDEEYGVVVAVMKPLGKILMRAASGKAETLEKKLSELLDKGHPEIDTAFAQNIG